MDNKNLKAIINNNNILLGVIITSNYNDFKNFIQFFFLIKIKKGNMYFDKKNLLKYILTIQIMI